MTTTTPAFPPSASTAPTTAPTALRKEALERLLRLQNKLFENAHKEPIELKSLGLEIGREGIDRHKLACNPDYLLLPFADCKHLKDLSREQMALITATYFATVYSEVASSESLALYYNLAASERAFTPYSDPYMVLFQETDEEYDHILAFRAICCGFVGRGDIIGIDHFRHLCAIRELLQRSETRLCGLGFASLYLLLRYVLNLALKQLEGFMCVGLDEAEADCRALEVVHGHSHDEARHLTTSLELGLGLFAQASAESRRVVPGIVRIALYSMIEDRFSRSLTNVWHHKTSLKVLDTARALHPELAHLPSAEELEREWQAAGIAIPSCASFEGSRRWLAEQIRRFVDRLELKLTPRGEAFEHYTSFAARTSKNEGVALGLS
jgi:hypothetical protein